LTEFGEEPQWIVQAPGRVNLIGEHTDYNDGFVMPLAIDRGSFIAMRRREDDLVRIRSMEFGETKQFNLGCIKKDSMSWIEYPKGVAFALQEEGFQLNGWEGVACCDVPMGASLSSSASIELAVARAFAARSGLEWNPIKMAVICQKSERQWVGVNCGIMDQMISAIGRKDHAALIDCRSLEAQHVPIPPGTSVVVMDTATRRGLVDSAYNERRSQCEAAADFFGVKALRDITLGVFEAKVPTDGAIQWRRARHVISEISRTLEAAEVMRQGDAVALGKLMSASHDSLRDDFEVTNDYLDAMVQIARRKDSCLGARMTGAGFGGCAIALVRASTAERFMNAVAAEYRKESGLAPKIYLCSASAGADFMKSCLPKSTPSVDSRAGLRTGSLTI